MSTATEIKKLRIALCLNQREFAQELGITISSVSYYEKGTRQPSFSTVRKIMALAKKKGLKINVEDIRIES